MFLVYYASIDEGRSFDLTSHFKDRG